jgi:hypothetical protein
MKKDLLHSQKRKKETGNNIKKKRKEKNRLHGRGLLASKTFTHVFFKQQT